MSRLTIAARTFPSDAVVLTQKLTFEGVSAEAFYLDTVIHVLARTLGVEHEEIHAHVVESRRASDTVQVEYSVGIDAERATEVREAMIDIGTSDEFIQKLKA